MNTHKILTPLVRHYVIAENNNGLGNNVQHDLFHLKM